MVRREVSGRMVWARVKDVSATVAWRGRLSGPGVRVTAVMTVTGQEGPWRLWMAL